MLRKWALLGLDNLFDSADIPLLSVLLMIPSSCGHYESEKYFFDDLKNFYELTKWFTGTLQTS